MHCAPPACPGRGSTRGPAGPWRPVCRAGLAGKAAIALGTPGQRPIADTETLGSFGGRVLPRGLAIGSDGRIFAADPAGRVILTALAGDGAAPRPADAASEWPFVALWPARPLPPPPAAHDVAPPVNPPADPMTLVRPLAVAIAPNGDLVIADAGKDGAGRVLVLAMPEGRLRHVIAFTEPVAISFDALGRACIADAGTGTIARFDRSWRREAGYPHASVPPIDGLAHLAHAHPQAGAACLCSGTCDCKGQGSTGRRSVDHRRRPHPRADRRRFRLVERRACRRRPAADADRHPPADIRLLPPALELASDGRLLWRDPAYPARDALALPGLLVDRGGRLAGTDLALLARPRRVSLPRSGVAQFLALDGGREGFAWDRIGLAASIPERTRLLVSTATTDAALEEAQLASLPASAWTAPLAIGPGELPEILVQSPGGRYLWLRLEMFGDGARTPEISAIEIFAPRRSSLAELPAPFREDPESAAFLDRFLSYFDTVFAEITAANAAVVALLDPHAVPAGPFLDWLASWFDITFLPEWPEPTRRAMVARAVEMYRLRGTVAGLRQMLRWHTGLAEPAPAIIEHFRITAPIFVAGSILAPSPLAHGFTIVLPAAAVPDASARARLEQVIAAAIPAHTTYQLRLVTAGIAIGRQSTPGVDMLLGSADPLPLGEAALGGDAMFPPGRPKLLARPPVACHC